MEYWALFTAFLPSYSKSLRHTYTQVALLKPCFSQGTSRSSCSVTTTIVTSAPEWEVGLATLRNGNAPGLYLPFSTQNAVATMLVFPLPVLVSQSRIVNMMVLASSS